MTHYYENGEHSYPSVTTIIGAMTDKSDALIPWAVGCACDYIVNALHERPNEGLLETIEAARTEFRTVSQIALDVGSEVHDAIEKYFTTGREPKKMSGQALAAFVAFLEWKDEHEVECMKTEHTVFGDCWAGTLDFYGRFDGIKYVIDWKSSKRMYPEMRYQIAAYRSCTDAEGCGILRLDKETGLPEWKDTSKTYKKDLFAFLKLVDAYMATHPRIAKKAGWKYGKI